MHFGCYSLSAVAQDPGVLYELGGGVLQEIAAAFKYELPRDHQRGPGSGKLLAPTSQVLSDIIGVVAPNKTLQDNIKFAVESLGPNAYKICVDWLDRACITDPIAGSFFDPTVKLPEDFKTVIVTGGVANWMVRRITTVWQIKPRQAGRIIIAAGNRPMGIGEHTLVETQQGEMRGLRAANHHNEDVTPHEHEFADRFVLPALGFVGHKNTQFIPVDSNNGNAVMAAVFEEYKDILDSDHRTLVIGNAPITHAVTGQFRLAARQIKASYDDKGDQLFMMGDPVRIARQGEAPIHGQNAISGIGALLRAYKALLDNATPVKTVA